MQIFDSCFVEIAGQTRLREAWAPRHRDGANVNEHLDACLSQRGEKALHRCAFVSDGGESQHAVKLRHARP
jgi:hypothetical protein